MLEKLTSMIMDATHTPEELKGVQMYDRETPEKFQANVEPISLCSVLYQHEEVFVSIKFYNEA